MSVLDFQQAARFETILADTVESRSKHFQMRYRVFCEETGFEDSNAFPDRQERDGYDKASAHFLVWDRFRRNFAGAMRLVDATDSRLPIEDITSGTVKIPPNNRDRCLEFSRLCIVPRYRFVKRGLVLSTDNIPSFQGSGAVPILFHQEDNEVLVRLIRAIVVWARQHRKGACYFLTTKALVRVLKRQKVDLKVIGPSVEHHGTRYPFVAHIARSHTNMKAGNALYRVLSGEQGGPFVKASDFMFTHLLEDDEFEVDTPTEYLADEPDYASFAERSGSPAPSFQFHRRVG